MIKGEKIRLNIYNILYSIYKFNRNLNSPEIQNLISKQNKDDIPFLFNATLNSMRFNLHSSKIINKYIKKKLKDKEKILLISAVTQIVFLDFKEYAVINCSVEIAKKINIYHGFINAILKKISNDKKKLKKINIDFKDFPLWFRIKADSLTKTDKEKFIKNFNLEPNLHLVFKNKQKLDEFDEKLIKTSDISGFLINKRDVKKIKSFNDGNWWVQDFSSFFPLYNLQIQGGKKKFLDACAAPGGKSFQVLSNKQKLTINDINKNRIKILKSNLKRLNFDANILNEDFTKFQESKKYDYIIIDAPCSAIGTIRKNPEIFFKSKGPNFNELNILQENMLKKASKILNLNGFIIYMVCSFFKSETEEQINNFLNTQSDFEIHNFSLFSKDARYSKLVKNKFMFTIPETLQKRNIDGYFAAYLKKIK